jgi:hypothetical protein
MKRFWILFSTEFKVWRHDPTTAMSGLIPPLLLLTAFGLLFGGRLSFDIAVINRDTGEASKLLYEAFQETISPLDNNPYYNILSLSETEAWEAYATYQIESVWIIPEDFSNRLEAGLNPELEMYFNNYNDDRAKNHRIYSAEVIWRFYEKIKMPPSPLTLAETYPLPEMVDWVSIIAVGAALLSAMVGGMMNIFMLTHKEKIAHISLEFALCPRSLLSVLLSKTTLALIMSLATFSVFLLILEVWMGLWPGKYLFASWLLAGLMALFWIAIALLTGLNNHNFLAGTIATILTGITIFFISGGINIVRGQEHKVIFISWLTPYIHAVDPLRDLILFHTIPDGWSIILLKLFGFAAVSTAVCWYFTARQLRRSH